MVIRVLVLVMVAVGLTGCHAAASGSVAYSIGNRTYHVYRPADLADPAPLVVFLHGGFGSGEQAEKTYGWDAEADQGHFLVAYPDGVDRAWNTGGGCCGTPARDNVDDVGFVTAMVAAIEKSVPVDAHKIYASGMSNGGIMAFTLACRTTIFAAIGPGSATQLGDCESPHPVSVIHIHGTADHNVPYDGGVGDGVAHINGPSAPDVDAQWRATDGCAGPKVSTDGGVTTSVADCPGGRRVELVSVAGMGHQWAPDATTTIWRFFSR